MPSFMKFTLGVAVLERSTASSFGAAHAVRSLLVISLPRYTQRLRVRHNSELWCTEATGDFRIAA